MKKIGVIANCHKPATRSVLERLVRKARDLGATVVSCDESAAGVEGITSVPSEDLPGAIEVLIAMGGDGTMLRAVRTLGGQDIPVLGVNIGSLGFMTSVPGEDLERAMDVVGSGDYQLSARTLAGCRVLRGTELLGEYRALNDIAIGWGASSRVVTLGVSIDGGDVASYVCDGMLVSTPTGSTGHSLSAGGPILHPDTCAFVLCPICPHTLSNRPVVIPDGSVIGIDLLETPKELLLAADGQGHLPLVEGDHVEIKKSDKSAKLILLPGYSYYSLLRQKLHWRGSAL